MNKKFSCYCILCVWYILGCPAVVAEKNMYKNSIDGVMIFSDRQTEHAEPIMLDSKKNLISTEPTNFYSNIESQSPPISNTNYNIKILNVSDEQTFRNIQKLEVRVSVTPTFRFELGQNLRLLVNKKKVPLDNGSSNLFTLTDIVRGKHELKAQVIDFEGRLLGESKNLTIYVHKHSILQ